MQLDRLELYHFKNYEQASFEFGSAVNCFTGRNGAGKTNILDAIHYLSMCKSYFNAIDSQNIKEGEDECSIRGRFKYRGSGEDLLCTLKKGSRKRFKRNDKEYERLSDHIGLFPVTMIAPSDQELILGGSELRRKFVDIIISQTDKGYLEKLIQYNRVLSQRNALLKEASRDPNAGREQFAVWDEQLCALGTSIFRTRRSFFADFKGLFQSIYSTISQGADKVSIKYNSHLEESSFEEHLEQSFQRDLYLQYTSKGTHKDDLIFEYMDRPVKKYGSQGQQKTFVIALKLAQFDFMAAAIGVKPLLLLDDIFDKLDDHRVKHLLELVAGDKFGQVFITHTHKERLQRLLKSTGKDVKYFEIDQNAIEA